MGKSKIDLPSIEESVKAFDKSLAMNSLTTGTSDESRLNSSSSKRAHLNLNKFTSTRAFSSGNRSNAGCLEGGTKATKRHSDVVNGRINDSSNLSLMDKLTQNPVISLQETHGHRIDGKRIFRLEPEMDRRATFEKPKFQESLRNLFKMKDYRSKRGSVVSVEEKRVSFMDVTIREYPIIVGDNPGCYTGPPVTIDWDHLSSNVYDFEKFEKVRTPNRRTMAKMILTGNQRRIILKALEFSNLEIQKGAKHATLVRNRRRRTNAEESKDEFHERIEIALRRFMNIVTLGIRKRKEKEYFKKCNCFPTHHKQKGCEGNPVDRQETAKTHLPSEHLSDMTFSQ